MGNQRSYPQPRVLVVRRNFWPHMSDATLCLLEWSKRLTQSGAQVTILSGRPNRNWPREVTIDRVRVVRLDGGWNNPLRNLRFSRAVSGWIDEHESNFELLYFDELEEEAIHHLGSNRKSSAPARVARFRTHSHLHSNSNDKRFVPWKLGSPPSPKSIVAACQRADAILVPSAIDHQHLLSIGLRHPNIMRMQTSGGTSFNRDIGSRREARRLLRDTNQDLICKSNDKLLLCPSDLKEEWNLEVLIKACGPLTESYPGLKLWILGDGPARARYYELIRQQGWHHSILMPGIFTDLEPLYQAADLCLLPGSDAGLDWHLPTSIASGLSTLAADSQRLRDLVGAGNCPLAFDAKSTEILRHKINHWLRHPVNVERAVTEIRNRWVNQHGRLNMDCQRLLQLAEQNFARN